MNIPNEIFKHPIPTDIYQKINGDRGIGQLMNPEKMGMCMELITNYLTDESKPTKKGWEDYYFTKQSKEPLIDATRYLIEKLNIDEDNAKHYIYHRIIGQTWNGMVSEFKVIEQLQVEFPTVEFKKTDFKKDNELFTDWEGFSKSGELLFGVQVKPITYYYMSQPHQLKVKETHEGMVNEYMNMCNVPHYMVYYDNGTNEVLFQFELYPSLNELIDKS
jgi:hypothetical protein